MSRSLPSIPEAIHRFRANPDGATAFSPRRKENWILADCSQSARILSKTRFINPG
jgi:hypothetical protein